MPLPSGTTLGPYEVRELLGKGGMGEVYRARDCRLDRDVALKVISASIAHDSGARSRFEREAKAIAALSHPNILAIFDFSKDHDHWYAVTELLEGETLRDRLSRGTIAWCDAVEIAREVTAGLGAAHERGIVHRDLKPENVFLTKDGGVKILDFGLALMRRPSSDEGDTEVRTTKAGQLVGTVGYMSPEQIRGDPVDAATDLFALGCMLYESIVGRSPFRGSSSLETVATILRDPPAPLPAEIPSDLARIVMRCLEKDAAARFPSARDLRAALSASVEDSRVGPASAGRLKPAPDLVTRVIVLPFRMLRPDNDLDFLSYSLPDAIVGSLAGINSLIVRSSLAASHYANQPLDIARVATEQDVNAIVSGTILASGGRLRVSAQLTDAPTAAVKWSCSTETSLDDIFGLQDELTRKIVGSLSGPLNDSDARALRKDVPRSALGYEFFLRANQQVHAPDGWLVARDLYRRSIEEDSEFAPAWARLGRCQWLIAKYTDEPGDNWKPAEEALRRAMELNPELTVAQRFYAELEIEGEQTLESLQRLMSRVKSRPNDPELRAALAKALRYTGLLQESLDAFLEVRRLDPQMPISIAHTLFMLGDYQRAHDEIRKDIFYLRPLTLAMTGREAEATRQLQETMKVNRDPQYVAYHQSLLSTLEGKREAAFSAADLILSHNRDPEAHFYAVRCYARLEEREKALDLLERVARSFFPVTTFQRDPWLASLRDSPRFDAIVRDATARHQEARAVWNASVSAS